MSGLRNILNLTMLFTCILFQTACPGDHDDPDLSYFYPPLKEHPLCRHELTVVGQDGDAIKARGFTGAVPANAQIKLQVHTKEVQTTATENGRFELTLPVTQAELKSIQTANLTVAAEKEILETKYRIRQIDDSLRQIPQKNSLNTASVPNDLVIAYQQERPFAIIPASLAGELHIFPLDKEPKNGLLLETKTLHFFPDETNAPANPFSVALDYEGKRVAVSLHGQHQIALVDIFKQKILSVAKAENAKHPQGLAFFGPNLLVAFTNLIESGTRHKPAQFGPGLLARFVQVGDRLQWMETLQLPCQNPTHVLTDDQGQAWVSCAGVFSFLDIGKISLTHPAAFLKIHVPALHEIGKFKVEHAIDLGNKFSPGLAVFTQGTIIAGNSIGPGILLISPQAKNINEGRILLVDSEKKSSSFPYAMPGFGNLVFITDFQNDRLLVLDMETQTLNPWPFTQGVPLTKTAHSNIFKGPIALAQRKGRPGIDFQAPEMFALFNLSAELIPLSFLKVMGP